MAENEIEISQLELAEELLKDMVFPVETATDTKASTLLQLKKWIGSGLPIGTIVPAVGKINDSRFTLLDGKTLASNGAYEDFYKKVVQNVQSGDWLACTEEEYDADLLIYGQCGRFVVEADYVRIPKITRFIGATINLSEFGKSFAQSLPQHTHTRGTMNIKGTADVTQGSSRDYNATGAFYKTTNGNGGNWDTADNNKLNFDASRAWTGETSGASDPSYQSGAKVQPDHVKFPYYMVIGSEGQKEEISVDINKVYEDINLKADRDELSFYARKDLTNIDPNIDYVVESYGPDSNYLWYRKYKSGFVEQGGLKVGVSNNSDYNVTLPVEMKEVRYTVVLGQELNTNNIYNSRQAMIRFDTRTTTGFSIRNARFSSNDEVVMAVSWIVMGRSKNV